MWKRQKKEKRGGGGGEGDAFWPLFSSARPAGCEPQLCARHRADPTRLRVFYSRRRRRVTVRGCHRGRLLIKHRLLWKTCPRRTRDHYEGSWCRCAPGRGAGWRGDSSRGEDCMHRWCRTSGPWIQFCTNRHRGAGLVSDYDSVSKNSWSPGCWSAPSFFFFFKAVALYHISSCWRSQHLKSPCVLVTVCTEESDRKETRGALPLWLWSSSKQIFVSCSPPPLPVIKDNGWIWINELSDYPSWRHWRRTVHSDLSFSFVMKGSSDSSA